VVLRPEQAESVSLQQPNAGLDRIAVQLSLSPHQLVYQNMHLHLCFFIAGGAEEVNYRHFCWCWKSNPLTLTYFCDILSVYTNHWDLGPVSMGPNS
jgi:hypothetical protein